MLSEIMAIEYCLSFRDFAEWYVFDYVPQHGIAYILETEQLISPDSGNDETVDVKMACPIFNVDFNRTRWLLFMGDVINSWSFINCCRPQHCVRNM